MKDANRNDQGKSSQQSYPGEDPRNRGAQKRPGAINIPGAAPEQSPFPNSDACEDEPLQGDDGEVQMASELESALDEAKARGDLREMPSMVDIKRKRES